MTEPARSAWRELLTADGSSTLVHPLHGEACHSSAGARLEALERYVRGCGLPERWRAEPGRGWRILDVGCGLGWNLAATLEQRERLEDPRRPRLELVTLENSREVLEAAFALQRASPQGAALGRVHAALRRSLGLASGTAVEVEPGVQLTLWLGDARVTVRALDAEHGFDAIYLDPFSPRREPGLWTAEFLGELAQRAAPGARLATYSAATAVRAALAVAGWRVGPGPRVGAKAEGTLASMGVALPEFSPRVARRIARRAAELGVLAPRPDPTD